MVKRYCVGITSPISCSPWRYRRTATAVYIVVQHYLHHPDDVSISLPLAIPCWSNSEQLSELPSYTRSLSTGLPIRSSPTVSQLPHYTPYKVSRPMQTPCLFQLVSHGIFWSPCASSFPAVPARHANFVYPPIWPPAQLCPPRAFTIRHARRLCCAKYKNPWGWPFQWEWF